MLRYGLPKVQWPPRELCGACRTPTGRWRHGEVLRFLRGSYCFDDAGCMLARNRSSAEGAEHMAEHVADAHARGEGGREPEGERGADGVWSPSLQLAIGVAAAACLLAVALSCLGGCVSPISRLHSPAKARRMRPVNQVPRVGLLSAGAESDE